MTIKTFFFFIEIKNSPFFIREISDKQKMETENPNPNPTEEDYEDIYSPQETEEYLREEIFQWIQLYQQEYPLSLSKPSYYQDATQSILEAVYPQWEKEPFIQEIGTEEDIGQIIYEMVCQFCPKRYSIFQPITPEDPDQYTQQLKTWQEKVQTLQILDAQNPKQGTTAWLKQRYNMITASDAYKALTSEAQRNNLIKSKSQPFHCYGTEDEDGNLQNNNGPASMEWGHMFEPVSVQIYEHITGEKVLFMGCIPHPQIPYLGASPDGVVSPWETDGGRCQRVQRLLEIKNPISRLIDGIPSEAYWIQQQIQMEVCDMEGCDFFETSFKTIDNFSMLFPKKSDILSKDSSGLSSEMSSKLHIENNVDDHPPTQDTETNHSEFSITPKPEPITEPITEPEPELSLYYGVIVEYKYHKWGTPFPSIKYLYLPPLTPLSGNIPFPLPKPIFENNSIIPEEESDSNVSDDSEIEDCSIWNLETETETETETDQSVSGDYHYIIDVKTNEFFDNLEDLQEHIDKQIPKSHPEYPEYKYSKKIYWKLENSSLVYVERNREWFEAAKTKLQEVWETIQQTRIQIQSIAPSIQDSDTKHISIHPSSSSNHRPSSFSNSSLNSSSNFLKNNQKSLKDWFV